MFGDAHPQCLGMGAPDVWGWDIFKLKYEASPMFGDGCPRCLGMLIPDVWG